MIKKRDQKRRRKVAPKPMSMCKNRTFDYDQVIELDQVFIDDCIEMYEKKHMCSIINDGKLVNFERRDD